jgi:hypothetical protein
MKKWIVIAVAAAVGLGLSGCKSDFTSTLRKDFQNEKVEMEKIQFYNSAKILLGREMSIEERKASAEGEYLKKTEDILYVVKIKCNTPGLCVKEDNDVLRISFEDDDNKYLPFRFRNGLYYLDVNNGKVEYNKQLYRVIKGDTSYLKIMISESDIDKKRQHTAGGKRLHKKAGYFVY